MTRVIAASAAIIGIMSATARVAEAQKPQKPLRSGKSTAQAAASRMYGEFTFGPTFGHTANASFGVEGGYWITDRIGVFVEGGRMRNVATSDIKANARIIAAEIGATATARQPVNYFDVGAIARIPISGGGWAARLAPYALFGLGAGNVSNDVTFSVNGSALSGQQLADRGVFLGSDLSGSYTKLLITLGAGTHVALTGRWFADVSYRFGSLGKNTDDPFAPIDAIPTNRFQFGVGGRF